ncbi:MAG: flagellar biosynthetic protein FliO [Lachnospiraceae bacterium]|jgi:flagellar protein FliO/FliZ|nr:flagellar biosynthetic protein FliO [Lachnospiraceae bacterium]MBQ9341745.1 flagellar biosynthetic protein FliO [Lachnospiraceae bacterium]MBR0435498.1 flagellar biosynthetic protein FliO [Lachnospiraceae bacterium]MCR5345341.1 flagellar biosynthetic protein FliO [Lachnospiraceae bacterium]
MIIGATGGDSLIQLIVVLVIFAFVLVMTVFTTRFIGGYQKLKMSNKNMQLIETLRLSNTKYLALMKVADKYVVIGVGKDEINKIIELDESEVPDIQPVEEGKPDRLVEGFQDILEKFKNKKG